MTNQEVITCFKQAAAVLAVKDTSPQKAYRFRAYQNAILNLENLTGRSQIRPTSAD